MNRRKFLGALGIVTVAAATGCRPDDPNPPPKEPKRLQFGRLSDQRPSVQDIRDAHQAGHPSVEIAFMNNFYTWACPLSIMLLRYSIRELRDAAAAVPIPLSFHGTIGLQESLYQHLRNGGGGMAAQSAWNELLGMGIRFSNAGPRSAESDLAKT